MSSENLLPNSPPIKSYQDFSRVFYGTQEGVSLLRKQYGPNGLQKARAKYGVNRGMIFLVHISYIPLEDSLLLNYIVSYVV